MKKTLLIIFVLAVVCNIFAGTAYAVFDDVYDVDYFYFKIIKNITYKSTDHSTNTETANKQTKLDIYMPEKAKNFPVILYIHGGSWSSGDKKDVGMKADFFMKKNYVFCTANYRLAPKNKYPDFMEDIADAFVWIKNNIAKYGGNPDRIFIMGHSAGAYMVALLGTNRMFLEKRGLYLDSIRGVICLDGAAYDIPERLVIEPESVSKIEAAFGKNPEIYGDASPIWYIDRDKYYPPFLLVHVGDWQAAKEETFAFFEEFINNGLYCEMVYIPEKNHGTVDSDLGKMNDKTAQRVLNFMNNYK